MKHIRIKVCSMFLFGIGLAGLQAQESNIVSGGEASGNGGSASYTVGQMVYTTTSGTSGSVSQGIQQPFEISVETGIEQKGIDLQCTVYPNPVTDYLLLNIDDNIVQEYLQTSKLSYQLFDTKGQVIATNKIKTTKTKIEMNNLTQGNYLLRIVENDKAIKTFKIVKR